jgi:hypothetical protein
VGTPFVCQRRSAFLRTRKAFPHAAGGIVALDDLRILLRDDHLRGCESLDRGILMLNSQSPEVTMRRCVITARIRTHSRGRERAGRLMQLKRILILAVLVAVAAILGKAGVHGGGWFNFTW